MLGLGQQREHRALRARVSGKLQVAVQVQLVVVAGQPGQQRQVGLDLQRSVVIAAAQLAEHVGHHVPGVAHPAAGERRERPVALSLQARAGVAQQAQRLVQVHAGVGERALAHLGPAQRGHDRAARLQRGRLGQRPVQVHGRHLGRSVAQRARGAPRQQLDHAGVAGRPRLQCVGDRHARAGAVVAQHLVGAPVQRGLVRSAQFAGHGCADQRMGHAQGPARVQDAGVGEHVGGTLRRIRVQPGHGRGVV